MSRSILKKIHDWRLFFFGVFVVLLLFQLGLQPIELTRYLGAGLGRAVGMSVGVPENSINKLALELKNKESQLDQREQAIAEREAAAGDQAVAYYLAGGIAILFILVIVNFFLDHRRREQELEAIDRLAKNK